jgi:hypothetical protein
MADGGNYFEEKSEQPDFAKLARWLGGIAATVLACYMAWYFTKPSPPPPPPPLLAVSTIEGMVYSGSAPVPNAMVAVNLTGTASANGPVYDMTDKNGAYRIAFNGLPRGAGATLSVSANGYEDATPLVVTGPLQADSRMDFSLAPLPGSDPVSVAPSVPQTIGKIPVYVRKSAAEAIVVKIPAIAAKKQ